MSKDELGGLPYQQAANVRQLLAERANASALGLTDRVAAADKQLRGLGWTDPGQAPPVSRSEPPPERQARHERVQKAEGEAGALPPVVRRGPVKHTG